MSDQYKKGDRVRRINSNNGAHGAKVGQEGTVAFTNNKFVYVDYQPRDPLGCCLTGPEGWRLENAELVRPAFKVGDKVAYRLTPDVVAGEVIAIFPNANPRQRLAVMLVRDDKAVRLHSMDGTIHGYSTEEDFVPLRRPVVTTKVWITSWIDAKGAIRFCNYLEKYQAEACKTAQMELGHPASVTEVNLTVDPN